MEQFLARGEGGDDEHPVEDIFAMKVIVAPMLLHPGGVLWVYDQFRGGDDGVTGKYFGFDTDCVITGLPGGLKVLDAPKITHRAKERPFSARHISGGRAFSSTLGDPLLSPGGVARRQVSIKSPGGLGHAWMLESRILEVQTGADGWINKEERRQQHDDHRIYTDDLTQIDLSRKIPRALCPVVHAKPRNLSEIREIPGEQKRIVRERDRRDS